MSQLSSVSQDSDALVSQGGKSRRSLMQKVLEPIRRVLFTQSTLRQASIREKKGPSLEKMSKFLISEVSTLQNLRTGPMKRLNDSSDVLKARHGILFKTCSCSKTKTKLHSTRPRKNGYSRLRQPKSRRNEFVEDLGVCIWSVRKTSTLLSWIP